MEFGEPMIIKGGTALEEISPGTFKHNASTFTNMIMDIIEQGKEHPNVPLRDMFYNVIFRTEQAKLISFPTITDQKSFYTSDQSRP